MITGNTASSTYDRPSNGLDTFKSHSLILFFLFQILSPPKDKGGKERTRIVLHCTHNAGDVGRQRLREGAAMSLSSATSTWNLACGTAGSCMRAHPYIASNLPQTVKPVTFLALQPYLSCGGTSDIATGSTLDAIESWRQWRHNCTAGPDRYSFEPMVLVDRGKSCMKSRGNVMPITIVCAHVVVFRNTQLPMAAA